MTDIMKRIEEAERLYAEAAINGGGTDEGQRTVDIYRAEAAFLFPDMVAEIRRLRGGIRIVRRECDLPPLAIQFLDELLEKAP